MWNRGIGPWEVLQNVVQTWGGLGGKYLIHFMYPNPAFKYQDSLHANWDSDFIL